MRLITVSGTVRNFREVVCPALELQDMTESHNRSELSRSRSHIPAKASLDGALTQSAVAHKVSYANIAVLLLDLLNEKLNQRVRLYLMSRQPVQQELFQNKDPLNVMTSFCELLLNQFQFGAANKLVYRH